MGNNYQPLNSSITRCPECDRLAAKVESTFQSYSSAYDRWYVFSDPEDGYPVSEGFRQAMQKARKAFKTAERKLAKHVCSNHLPLHIA
jgi:hypothetical protein